jgi:TolA-binding protein
MPSAYSGINMFEKRPYGAIDRKSSSLLKAEKAFIKGDYEEVIILGSSYLSRRTKEDELQYLAGRALLKLERFNEARNRFTIVINYSDNDKFLDKAHMGLADSYYLEGDYDKAKEYYEKVMKYFPDTDDISIIYYKLGNCYSKTGQDSTSRTYYDKLVESFPDSLETKLLAGEK